MAEIKEIMDSADTSLVILEVLKESIENLYNNGFRPFMQR
jgi:hypothetical protein